MTARHVVEGMKSVRLVAPEAKGGNIKEIILAANQLADVALLRTDLDFSWYLGKVQIHGMQYQKTDHLQLGVEWDEPRRCDARRPTRVLASHWPLNESLIAGAHASRSGSPRCP